MNLIGHYNIIINTNVLVTLFYIQNIFFSYFSYTRQICLRRDVGIPPYMTDPSKCFLSLMQIVTK